MKIAIIFCASFLMSILSLSATGDKQTPGHGATPPSVLAGQAIYKQHCAVCHGNDLKGNGPAPAPFAQETPDLTTLARRHAGFPDDYISNILRNGAKIAAHGPAEMPIWGTTFREAEELNEAQVSQRIKDLTSYIKSKQAK
jgi:mono/diheme cytochrome c family protein